VNAAIPVEPPEVREQREALATLHATQDEAGPTTDSGRRSWQPVDLTAVLDGTWRPPQPTVGKRSDGIGLFYPGKVHTISSESEAGKTWLVLSAVIDELRADNHVVYLDFEDDEGGVTGRLLTLGCPSDQIRQLFHYIRPEDPIGSGIHRDDLAAVLADMRPTLGVVDGVTEAMTLHGLDPNSNSDAALFGRMLPRRLANSGAASVSLDHVPKSTENRGRYSIGAVHKLNALDGAAYILDNRAPFGVGITGRSTLRIAKDRPGQLRRHAFPSASGLHWFGDLILDSHDEEFADVSIEPPHQADESFRPTVLMSRISEALAEHGPLAQRRIIAAVHGKTDAIRAALDYLILDGYVSESTPHQLIKPFQDEDK
jgi:hypothetical protein